MISPIAPPRRRLLILACSAMRRGHPKRIPAPDRDEGPLQRRSGTDVSKARTTKVTSAIRIPASRERSALYDIRLPSRVEAETIVDTG